MPIDTFSDEVTPLLGLIDERLALKGTRVHDRPIAATRIFLKEFVVSVRPGDQPELALSDAQDHSNEPWFKSLYSSVEHWYRSRYAERLEKHRSSNEMRAVVLVAHTPFELRVPISHAQVEEIGKTSWLSWPNKMLSNEEVTDWILTPPNWQSYEAETITACNDGAREIATLIRRISSRLIGASLKDGSTRNVLAGVRLHLTSACELILREGEEGSFARAQWELQMASESAYKGFLQQRDGVFAETHDLFTLHDTAAIASTSVDREWLKALPRWKDAANLRYGLGDHPTVVEIHCWYLLSLKIIAGVLENIEGLNLGSVKLLLKKAPWL
jgi:hypothetical protein